MNRENIILSLDSILTGYRRGKTERVLLPALSADAGRGELIALVGKNGIGKSTMLRTIAGLQPCLGGHVSLMNKDLSSYNRKELAMLTGYISTEPVRIANMKVWDLVALGRFPFTNWIGRLDQDDITAVSNAIGLTSMEHLASKNITELSDGERQKAMIARLLAQDTGIMIMDEPTAFLDIESRFEIIHLLHRLASENKKTIIYSTHDIQTAISESDKMWIIDNDGLTQGAPEDLILNGAAGRLLSSASISFNSDDGTFRFITGHRGDIYIKGEGAYRFWTAKALQRSGFRAVDSITDPYIITPVSENGKWILDGSKTSASFGSLYDLMAMLRRDS